MNTKDRKIAFSLFMKLDKMKISCIILILGVASGFVIPDNAVFEENFDDVFDFEVFEALVASASNQTVPQMVAAEGYPVESHYITTSDGYVLNIHRIPYGKSGRKNKGVVFLQHGLLESSADWVLLGPGKSLGYILADEGYDVWMGNGRGNAYSRNHTTLDPNKNSSFWQFSWHEIGIIDLPQMIDFVLETTGSDGVYYCGHSQGTTSFYVLASLLPEYNDKIKAQISLAPVAFMKHMTSPLLSIMAFWHKPLGDLFKLIGMNEFLPKDGFTSRLSQSICDKGVGQILCKNVLFALCGFSPNQMNTTTLPLIMAHTPAGAATKQVLHYGQEIKSGYFRQFDYGLIENKKLYGSISPPSYDLNKITAPVYLIYSGNDWLAGEKDVQKLHGLLPNCKGKFSLSKYKFNHLDFLFGIDAPTRVYNKVISLLSKH